jgi:hypothetical protein
VLGFVNFGEALGLPEIPSNLGLRDPITALEWVRANIRAFGGDPKRITITGESAGSTSVSLLMLCQQAWPFFHGAIMQSGALSMVHEREKSQRVARRYAQLLNVGPRDLDSLRNVELKSLFEAQAVIDREELSGIAAAPWFGGDLLPDSLLAARGHATADVPLLSGATRCGYSRSCRGTSCRLNGLNSSRFCAASYRWLTPRRFSPLTRAHVQVVVLWPLISPLRCRRETSRHDALAEVERGSIDSIVRTHYWALATGWSSRSCGH